MSAINNIQENSSTGNPDEKINEIASQIRNKNQKEGTFDTALFHNPTSNKLYLIDYNGRIKDSNEVFANLATVEDDLIENEKEVLIMHKKLENSKYL